MNFNTLVEQLLLEMPYIEVNGQMFDLEVERFKNNREGFIRLINAILNGTPATDKYGNTIHIKTVAEREAFKDAIKKEHLVMMILAGAYEGK